MVSLQKGISFTSTNTLQVLVYTSINIPPQWVFLIHPKASKTKLFKIQNQQRSSNSSGLIEQSNLSCHFIFTYFTYCVCISKGMTKPAVVQRSWYCALSAQVLFLIDASFLMSLMQYDILSFDKQDFVGEDVGSS